jgi:hypothetical protein
MPATLNVTTAAANTRYSLGSAPCHARLPLLTFIAWGGCAPRVAVLVKRASSMSLGTMRQRNSRA